MKTTVQIRRLTLGSIFKLIAIGTFLPVVGYFILCGLFALGGAPSVRVNGAFVTGMDGLIASIVTAPLFWGLLTLIGSFSLFAGLWVFSLIRPMKLSFLPAEILSPAFPIENAQGGAEHPSIGS